MSPPTQHDRRLHSLLSELALHLAGSGANEALVRLEDVPGADEADLARLCAAGLLSTAEPARSTICEGCERACPMDVTWSEGSRQQRAFVVCDKRDDIGRVAVEPASLRQWRVSLEQIATATAKLLGTDRMPSPIADGRAWTLGTLLHGGSAVEAVLCVRVESVPTLPCLTVALVPSQSESHGPSICLSALTQFCEGCLLLNRAALERAFGASIDDGRIALEIRFEAGCIVLVNHVTGARRTIAKPDFNSLNDNVFQALCNNPGRTYSVAELERISGRQRLKSLHKIPENLNFKGNLKQVFFRVSAGSIQFRRAVTVAQLATLGIDPRRIAGSGRGS